MSLNPYDTGGPVYVGPEPDDSVVQPTSTIDFANMDAKSISDYAQAHPEWFEKNSSLVDYWLNEKSYDRRASQNIISQYKQLEQLGVNPVLAMSLLGGSSGASLSGGASSSADSYFGSKYSSDQSSKTSRANNLQSTATRLIALGITALMALLL